jgi:hypothetical protein
MHTGFWWGNLRKRDQLQDLDTDGRIILKARLGGGRTWTGLIWLNTETSGKLL